MKVVSIVGGLGSQMFKYAFYLALKETYKEPIFIDNSFYEQNKCWNGYELSRIFKIDAPTLVDHILEEGGDGAPKDTYYLKRCLDYLKKDNTYYYLMGKRFHFKKKSRITKLGLELIKKSTYIKFFMGIKHTYKLSDFIEGQNYYFDEYFHNSDEHFADFKDLVKKTFVFPELTDEENKKTASTMEKENSVAMHVRRGDHLSDNANLYKTGYYQKAVKHIKDNEKGELVFYLFSDDLDWCKENLETLGLKDEKVVYVDWNKKENSYKDMQIMTYCKHNIVAISSFSWWGYYLSNRSDKIVVSPKGYWLDIKTHF